MKDWGCLHDLCRLRSTLEAYAVRRWRESGGLTVSPLDFFWTA
jgi:hypothetical protein